MQTGQIYNTDAVQQWGLAERRVATPVDVSFVTGKEANLFCQHDGARIGGVLLFHAEEPQSVRITYQVLYHAYSVAYPLQDFPLELPVGDTEKHVEFPETDGLYGVFRLEVCIFAKDALLCRKRFSFSRAMLPDRADKSVGISAHLFSGARIPILEVLDRIGVGSIRDDISWGRVEKEKGLLVPFPQYDETAQAVKRLGTDTLLILNYGNSFYDGGKNPHSDEGIAAFARFCAETARHYRGTLAHFEIWNEYNLLAFNQERRTPADYTRMLKAAYTAIKAANPEAVVCTAGTCNGHPAWLRGILDAGAYDYFDEVGIHPYCCSQGPVYPDHGRVREEVEGYRRIIEQYGAAKPVVVTEIGWKTNAGGGGGTPAVQAAAIIRNLALSQSAETPYPIFTYTDSDGTNPFDPESHFGILESSCTESPRALKEAAAAIAAWTTFAAGGIRQKMLTTGCVYGYAAQRTRDDTSTNVLWSTDGLQEVNIGSQAKEITVYDLYGTSAVYRSEDGTYCIEIGDAPVYIRTGGNIPVEILSVTAKETAKKQENSCSVRLTPQFSPKNGWQITATVSNRHPYRDMVASLAVFNETRNYYRNAVRVAAGADEQVSIPVPDAPTENAMPFFAQLQTCDGECVFTTERIRFWGIPHVDTEDFFENGSGEKVHLGQERYVPIPKNDVDEKATRIEAELRFGWNEKHFLLAADVTDGIHAQNGLDGPFWKDIWDGDGLQFAITLDGDAATAESACSEFGAALSSVSDEALVWRWVAPKNRCIKRYTNGQHRIWRENGHTYYAIAIEWTDILPRGSCVTADTVMAFGLHVNNADDLTHDLVGYLPFGDGVGCRCAGTRGGATLLNSMVLFNKEKECQ